MKTLPALTTTRVEEETTRSRRIEALVLGQAYQRPKKGLRLPEQRVAALVRPAISLQQGKKDQAITELKSAIQLAEKNQMLFQLAGAQRRLGQLLGLDTEEGRALFQASEDYAQEGLKTDRCMEIES